MENFLQDVRHGFRILTKNPGFSIVVIAVLAIGIGLNTTIFSVINAVLLRPLPYEDPGRLARISMSRPDRGTKSVPVSAPDFDDWKSQNRVFEDMAVYQGWSSILTGGDEPEYIKGFRVSANLFSVLGVAPALGRTFSPEECVPGRDRVVVINHEFWRRRFGFDVSAIGQTLTFGQNVYSVVGVMPPGFTFPGDAVDAEIWKPLALDPNETARDRRFLNAVARLNPDATFAEARSEMNVINARLKRQYPDTNSGWETQLLSLHEQMTGNTRPALLILLGAVGLVLVIVCASLAILLLARAIERQKEIAIRSALGASRSRLISQMLTESLLLAGIGGAIGLVLAPLGTKVFIALGPGNIPRLNNASTDATVLVFALVASFATGLISGLVPATQLSNLNLNSALKESGLQTFSGSRWLGYQRARSLLVITEVAVATVLLVGAGLMIKSFWLLQEIDLGFVPDSIVVIDVLLPGYRYPGANQKTEFFDRVIESIKATPGVESAVITEMLPLTGASFNTPFTIEARPDSGSDDDQRTSGCAIGPDYFEAIKAPILQGRQFTGEDREGPNGVVIVNQAMANHFWQRESPIGQRIRLKRSGEKLWEIVGVVGNIKQFKVDTDTPFYVYVPFGPSASGRILVARTKDDPSKMIATLRSRVWAIDKDVPILRIGTMNQIVSQSIAPPRFNVFLLSTFATLAVVVAVIALYGLMAYSVSQRTREIGIRMALGARPSHVISLIIRQGLILALAGIVIGMVLAIALTRLMSGLLFGVSSTDPSTFAVVSCILIVVAGLACLAPARRATRVDPAFGLHYE